MKIAYITDIHLEEEPPGVDKFDIKANLATILEDLHNRDIKEVVLGGDLGKPATNAWLLNELKSFDLDITPGNHDDAALLVPLLNKKSHQKVETWDYFYEKEGFRWIFIDTSKEIIKDSQLNWLSEALNTSLNVLLFVHHPVVPIDEPIDKKYPLPGREEILKKLIASGKTINIYSGHYHMAHYSEMGEIKQFITPAISFQVVRQSENFELDTNQFGYRIIEVNSGKVESKLMIFNT